MSFEPSLPAFQPDGALPPFVGEYPDRSRCTISPYPVTIETLRARFCWDSERDALLTGLERYNELLQTLGVSGKQWIGGSFVTTGSAADIDLVNLFVRPQHASSTPLFNVLVAENPEAFDRPTIKSRFGCEAYFVDCGLPARLVAEHVAYYATLLSHDRLHRWRGFVELELC